MINLHQITHDNKLVAEKVNFFSDYFTYVKNNIGKSFFLPLENHLSIIEKIIFQIETNPKNNIKYINNYINNPLLRKNNKYFKQYKNYNQIINYFSKYNKTENKKDWIKNNPDFLKSLKRFKTELKKIMFKKALKEIISFLKCPHKLTYHINDIIYNTNILVSELILNSDAKDDINIFSKILSKDLETFPFPKNIKTKKNKTLFLKNLTFDEQLNGIYNWFKEKGVNEYFIFKAFDVDAEKDFKFKYNDVTFYSLNHQKLTKLKKLINKEFFKDFFDDNNAIIASVRVKYSNNSYGKLLALNKINNAIKYLNISLNTNFN